MHVILRHRILLLIATTAVVLTVIFGLLAGLSLVAVALAIVEHHLRLRYQAAFRNCRRMLAAESRRSDAIEDYLEGVLSAVRGDAEDAPKRILH